MTSVVDAYCSERHYLDHVAAVWSALPVERRGVFRVRRGLERYVGTLDVAGPRWPRVRRGETPTPTIVGSFSDARTVRIRVGRHVPLVVVDHGVGQTYVGVGSGAYVGGSGFGRFPTLFVAPTRTAARGWSSRYGDRVDVVEAGPVVLDDFVGTLRPADVEIDDDYRPTVVVSFHWRCPLVPETGSAFDHYRDEIERLVAVERPYRIVGHAHPRIAAELSTFWQQIGVEYESSYRRVLDEADVFVGDNTSALFHVAALDRPVVVLDAPEYRRRVEHGLRFWRYANVGVRISEPVALDAAIREAIDDPEPVAVERRRIVDDLFGGLVDGRATYRAADGIAEWLDGL